MTMKSNEIDVSMHFKNHKMFSRDELIWDVSYIWDMHKNNTKYIVIEKKYWFIYMTRQHASAMLSIYMNVLKLFSK